MLRFAIIASLLIVSVGIGAFLLLERRQGDELSGSASVIDDSRNPEEQKRVQQDASLPSVPNEHAGGAPAISDSEAIAIEGLDARSLTVCNRALLKKKGLEDFSCERIAEGDTLAQNHCREQVAAINRRLQEIAAKAAPCPESLAHPSAYYGAIKALAERGDVHAQRCFIQGYFGISREIGMTLAPSETEEFATLARKYVDERLAHGDWSVVRWLTKSRLSIADTLLASAYPIGTDTPETIYRMSRLLVLGNQPG